MHPQVRERERASYLEKLLRTYKLQDIITMRLTI